MAKVESMPSCMVPSLGSDDALSGFSLEIRDESPPKYDFAINRFLCDNEINLNEKLSDNSYLKNNEFNGELPKSKHHISSKLSSLGTDNEVDVLELLQETDTQKYNSRGDCRKPKLCNTVHMAPNNSGKLVVNGLSLSSLAENHFKFDHKSEELKDFDTNCPLSELLTDIAEHSAVENLKTLNSNGNSNLFDLSFSLSNDSLTSLSTNPMRKTTDEDDLSVLLELCEEHSIKSNNVSLADLANSHFLTDLSDNLEENVSTEKLNNYGNKDGIHFNLPSNLKNILPLPDKSNLNILKVEQFSFNENFGDILIVENTIEAVRSCEKIDKFLLGADCLLSDIPKVENIVDKVLNSCEKGEGLPTTDSSDDEIVPDIDLKYCVKKHSTFNDNFTLNSASPGSPDSGFDEIDSECSHTNTDFVSLESTIYFQEKHLESTLNNPKQSLLSKAISCKPKSDKTKSEKLKEIKKDLFNKYFPTAFMTFTNNGNA